jgi:hypothetical protein
MTTNVRAPATEISHVNRVGVRRHRAPGVVESRTSLPWSMRVLRAFLGATFVFAGVQKPFDPNFPRREAPTTSGPSSRRRVPTTLGALPVGRAVRALRTGG